MYWKLVCWSKHVCTAMILPSHLHDSDRDSGCDWDTIQSITRHGIHQKDFDAVLRLKKITKCCIILKYFLWKCDFCNTAISFVITMKWAFQCLHVLGHVAVDAALSNVGHANTSQSCQIAGRQLNYAGNPFISSLLSELLIGGWRTVNMWGNVRWPAEVMQFKAFSVQTSHWKT